MSSRYRELDNQLVCLLRWAALESNSEGPSQSLNNTLVKQFIRIVETLDPSYHQALQHSDINMTFCLRPLHDLSYCSWALYATANASPLFDYYDICYFDTSQLNRN